MPASLDVCNSGKLVDPLSWVSLLRPVSSSDVWDVVSSFGNDKAPGPDGYSAKFFKAAWPIIGPDVVGAVQEFFESGRLLKQINHANIVLIPKSPNASKVGDFRPISLCNILYKIIAKILAIRIKPVLEEIVSDNQAAFLGNRLMSENIFLVQELLRKYARKRISPRCMLKVDLHKAFDSIDWGFLQWMLASIGFPPRFVGWIMECVSTTSYSILVNGSIFGHFKGARGIRQGDPLSPYLFVLCLEYFSRMVNSLDASVGFHFHPGCQHLKLTHLAFADDLMLFCRGDLVSVRLLMDCLRDFHEVSGLAFNAHKSSIYVAGIHDSDLQDIIQVANFGIGSFPFRYLGVPLLASRLNVCHFAPLFDRIRALIAGWSQKLLSYAGRLELIRAVVGGIMGFSCAA